MRIKICGLTRAEDAALAARLGAWAVGFVFHPKSPRAVTPEAAGAIISGLPAGVTPVGVFVNAAAEEIARVARISGIRIAQLHGDEPAGFAESLPIDTIQARRLAAPADVEALGRDRPTVAHLVDASVAGEFGGTGVKADWKLASDARRHGKLILSGGLTPANVGEAIRAVGPWAVDVSSGVEARPGIKSELKMREFFRRANEESHVDP